MALIVEDGTGLQTANSYASVSEADIYFTERNNSVWSSYSNAQKEAGLLYATAYIDANYDWPGFVYDLNQSLDWPRSDAYDQDDRLLEGLPRKLKHATFELALQHNSFSLSTSYERAGAVKREKVGVIEIEYESNAPAAPSYPLVDSLLSAITSTGSGVVQLIRG